MTNEIHKRIIAIMRDSGAIGKNKKNTGQGYNFRGIDDVMNELHEHFTAHGVFILPEVLDINREERQSKSGSATFYTSMRVRFTFMTEDGSMVSCTTAGEGMDSGDKSTNKAMSAALKYALLQMLLIPTEETKDSEADNHDVKYRRQDERLERQLNQHIKNTAPDFDKLRIELSNATLDDIRMLWANYADHHTNTEVKSMFSKRKAELNSKSEPQSQQ